MIFAFILLFYIIPGMRDFFARLFASKGDTIPKRIEKRAMAEILVFWIVSTPLVLLIMGVVYLFSTGFNKAGLYPAWVALAPVVFVVLVSLSRWGAAKEDGDKFNEAFSPAPMPIYPPVAPTHLRLVKPGESVEVEVRKPTPQVEAHPLRVAMITISVAVLLFGGLWLATGDHWDGLLYSLFGIY
jgi:hypothetical protein